MDTNSQESEASGTTNWKGKGESLNKAATDPAGDSLFVVLSFWKIWMEEPALLKFSPTMLLS